jgi:LysM repeat protein
VVEHEPHKRVWAARLVAPAAFFAASIALVVLIQRGLDEGSSTAGNTTPVVTTTPPTTTTSDTTTETPRQRQSYRVRSGDTLESIAAKFDTTVDDLYRLNPDIDPLALSPGQRIRVS